MIDFANFLIALGLIATVFVGGIMIGYFAVLQNVPKWIRRIDRVWRLVLLQVPGLWPWGREDGYYG